MLSDYKILKCLGRGGFGQVYLGVSKKKSFGVEENQMVAIKAISKTHLKSIKLELEMFKMVRNKSFLSQMLCAFDDLTRVFLVLRFEPNGSLYDYICRHPNMPVDVAQGFTIDILLGLNFLHTNNIIHGDLKCENVLIDGNLRAHVADFGLCASAHPKKLWYGRHGSRGYQAPEQLVDNIAWDHRVDYFVVGIIFFMMLKTRHPFGELIDEIEKNVLKIVFEMPNLPNAGISFLRSTLCHHEKRVNCITVMRHEFIAPFVSKRLTTYAPSVTFHRGELPTKEFHDEFNFFLPIPGLESYKEEENNDAALTELFKSNGQQFESNSGASQFLNDVQNQQEKFAAIRNGGNDSLPNQLLEPIVQLSEASTDNPVISELKRQLNNFPGAEGCTIRKENSNVYKIRCNICSKSIQATKLDRGIKVLKRSFNVQPLTRHLERHRNKKAKKNKKRSSQ